MSKPEIPTLGAPSDDASDVAKLAATIPVETKSAEAKPAEAKPAKTKPGIFGKKNPFARGDDKPTPLF